MRLLVIFYVLVIYVFLQFTWWAVLLVDLNAEVYEHRIENLSLTEESHAEYLNEKGILENSLKNKWMMIAGEGLVFIIILSIGVVQTRNAFKKEILLSKQQRNFLLSVTHEFKSPISAIKLALQTMKIRELSRDKQIEMIDNSLEDTLRLHELVENVLMAAMLDNRNYLFHPEESDLSLILEKVLNDYEKEHTGSIIITRNIEPEISYNIDKMAFDILIRNLVGNAIKYSDTPAEVEVKMIQEKNNIFLSVADKGLGIDDEEKLKIFQKFYRVGNEETRKSQGTGLGLYIVNNIVEKHSGKIVIKDNSPKGSIFEICFKCDKVS